MTKIPARRILSSVFGRIDTAFRVAAIGFAVVALGVVLALIAGSDATGPLAEAAAYLLVSGMAVVFAAGSLRFVLTVVRLWRRFRN